MGCGAMYLPPEVFSSSFLRSVNRSEEHTSELQSQFHLVCRLLLEKKKRMVAGLRERLARLAARPVVAAEGGSREPDGGAGDQDQVEGERRGGGEPDEVMRGQSVRE